MTTIATITDNYSKQWWTKFYRCSFKVLSIRQETVICKSNSDEGYSHPFNIHEFPKEAVELSKKDFKYFFKNLETSNE